MEYLSWNEKIITDFSEKNIADMYARGYIFTRIGKGVMHQTRSVRINLKNHSLTSENRRILKKVDTIILLRENLPAQNYNWQIGKLGKDFYDLKFKSGIMSVQKIKEMLTDSKKSNFNSSLTFLKKSDLSRIGYAICYENSGLLHYSYPFYDINASSKDMGLGMMIMAIQYAGGAEKKFIYLGSLQRPGDIYKLQFEGLEWFDGGPDGNGKWRSDMEAVKKILAHYKK